MVLEHTQDRMDQATRDNGRMDNLVEKEFMCRSMVISMKVYGITIKNMEEAYFTPLKEK